MADRGSSSVVRQSAIRPAAAPTPIPMHRFRLALLSSFLFAAVGGCDNVGRAFDPNANPEEPGATPGTSTVQVVPVGGDVRDGRPKVRAAFPSGGGWPTVVPIVVEFSESLNQASILPTTPTGTDARVILRVRGTTQALPCQYDFVAGGRVLVMRPLTALSNAQAAIYEVVLLADARDADGVRFLVDGGQQVLTDFQVNQAASFTDGRILTTFPRDNARDVTRESDYFVFFDRPANEASITAANLRLRRGGADVGAARAFPLTIVGVADPRVVRIRPTDRLPASTRHELVVDATITFGQGGALDFRGRTPFAVFDTVAPAAPTAVVLGNPATGFPNKINRSNASSVVLHVTTAADTVAGDRVVARIYGGNAETATNTADQVFVERTGQAAGPGAQTVTIDFGGLLGTLVRPKFDDGALTFAVQAQRGGEHSGFAHSTGDDDPAFDITLPTLSRTGPPSLGTGFDVVTDQESLAFYGTASEAVGEVMLADGVNPEVGLFAAADDGRFLLRPLALGRLSSPRNYSMTLRDRAGNFATGAVSGQIVQRGFVTGTVGSDLTVEVFDQRTLLPIANATVLVDPGTPVVPATGQLVGMTAANGRVSFTGLTAPDHTITVVRAGFHLLTIYRTTAAMASLPLRPLTGATATLQGNVLFTQAPNTTVLVGSTAFDDANEFGVRTTNAAPTKIPSTALLPNRPAIVTAFGGVFEPTAPPAFSFQGFQSLGADLMSLTPPLAPPAAGGNSDQNIVLLPSAGAFGSLIGAYTEDFGLATGLDTTSLVGGLPFVRVTASLQGFGGQVLMGVGFATAAGGTSYNLQANWTQPGFAGLATLGPLAWVVADARDQSGRISRHRVLLNLQTGNVVDETNPQPIPTVSVPGTTFTGSPLVTFADVVDPAVFALGGGLAHVDVTAEDVPGRRWLLIVADTDPVGGSESVQFPDLSVAGVTGLQAGTWSIRAEARLWFSFTASPHDFVLLERRRAEVNYSRGIAIPFTIQ